MRKSSPLCAYQKYNNVLIDVYDDGAGLDIQRIKIRFFVKHLASQDAVEKMSQEELIQFIFEAGLAQKKSASKISGRGVGLDIVKDKVNKLGGEIKVNTEKGNGTNLVFQSSDYYHEFFSHCESGDQLRYLERGS